MNRSFRSCVAVLLLLCVTGCEISTPPQPQARRQYRPTPIRRQIPRQPQPTMPYQPDGCPDGMCPHPARSLPAVIANAFDVTTRAGAPDLPVGIAEHNWRGRHGSGSCAWASLITALRWQGQDNMAAHVKSRYDSGATWRDLKSASDTLDLKYTYTARGDSRLLEWASQTKRAGVVFYKPQHAVTFVGFDGNDAVIIDPNHPQRKERIDKQAFINNWRHRYQGVFFVPIYAPGTPTPTI